MAVADDDVGVPVEAVSDAAHGADDVLVATELRAEATHVDVDGALTGSLVVLCLPEGGDQFAALDGAALAEHGTAAARTPCT